MARTPPLLAAVVLFFAGAASLRAEERLGEAPLPELPRSLIQEQAPNVAAPFAAAAPEAAAAPVQPQAILAPTAAIPQKTQYAAAGQAPALAGSFEAFLQQTASNADQVQKDVSNGGLGLDAGAIFDASVQRQDNAELLPRLLGFGKHMARRASALSQGLSRRPLPAHREPSSPSKKDRYVEDLLPPMPVTVDAISILRVGQVGLRIVKSDYQRISLSQEEVLQQEGFPDLQFKKYQPGEIVTDANGNAYRVTGQKGKQVFISDGEISQTLEFQPRKVRARVSVLEIRDEAGRSHRITVQDFASRGDPETAANLLDLIKALPVAHIDSFQLLRFMPQSNVKAGVARQEGRLLTRDVIDIHIKRDSVDPALATVETGYHEFGHSLARKLYGSIHPGLKWREAKSLDGNEISEYAENKRYAGQKPADNGEIEDFAEAVRLYLATDGGRAAAQIRDALSHRFAILDDIFQGSGRTARRSSSSWSLLSIFRR